MATRSGVVARLLAALRGVTRRTRPDDRPHEGDELFRAVFEHAPVGILVTTMDGRFLDMNETFAGTTAFTREEAIGKTFADVNPPENHEPLQEVYERLQADGYLQDLEVRLTGAASDMWFQISATIVDQGGAGAYAIFQVMDVTARKLAEADRERLLLAERAARAELESTKHLLDEQNIHLRDAIRAKDEMISIVSHDLRTPLTSIVGYVELLTGEDGDPLTDEQRTFLATVGRNAARLQRLVEDLLLIARAVAGQLELDLGDVDVEKLVRRCIEAARPMAAERGVQVDLDVRPARLRGDRARLDQLLDNLVSNAIKFTPAGGSLRVGLAQRGEHVLLTVSDTGAGISKQDQKHLFERFFRAEGAHAVPGTGLGLSIAKAIVDSHGGTIAVESEEGAGTAVTVELPLVARTDAGRVVQDEVPA